jgi:uncharacterized protein (DUF4415 family)
MPETANAIYSTLIRAGKTSYFVDVKEAKNGAKYMQISQTSIDGAEKKERVVIRVYADVVEPFRQAIEESAASIIQ